MNKHTNKCFITNGDKFYRGTAQGFCMGGIIRLGAMKKSVRKCRMQTKGLPVALPVALPAATVAAPTVCTPRELRARKHQAVTPDS